MESSRTRPTPKETKHLRPPIIDPSRSFVCAVFIISRPTKIVSFFMVVREAVQNGPRALPGDCCRYSTVNAKTLNPSCLHSISPEGLLRGETIRYGGNGGLGVPARGRPDWAASFLLVVKATFERVAAALVKVRFGSATDSLTDKRRCPLPFKADVDRSAVLFSQRSLRKRSAPRLALYESRSTPAYNTTSITRECHAQCVVHARICDVVADIDGLLG
jgi:hypothetical protein